MQNVSNKPVGIVLDSIFKNHLTPDFHKERPERLDILLNNIEKLPLNLIKYNPVSIDKSLLRSVHTKYHIKTVEEKVNQAKKNKRASLDQDTWVSPESFDTALKAVGSCFNLVDKIFLAEIQNAFSFIRPPGHHAYTNDVCGFCLFNNIALTARYILDNYDLSRVAIVDFDVHHGNGTQQIFYHYNNVLTVSLHQYPFWPPNSGNYTEIGESYGKGFNINIPFERKSRDMDYFLAFKKIVIPILKQYKPQFIVVAAGFDGHIDDNISDICLSSKAYYYFINFLKSVGSDIPIICILEGGYNPKSVYDSSVSVLKALSEKKATDNSAAFIDASDNYNQINDINLIKTIDYLTKYWDLSSET